MTLGRIFEFLTPVSLAYWIACDGYKKNQGVGLATNSLSIPDNEKLVKALNDKFGFSCWIVDDHGSPSIYIPKSDLIKLQELVATILHPTLLYKIHL